MTSSIALRKATLSDVPLVLTLIKKLAAYERLAHEAVATESDIAAALFGPEANAEVLIAECDGRPAGFALFFHNFSTFVGRRGIYLEDLFVEPEFRGRGIGKRLLLELARIAIERGCGRFDWAVLDWNQPTIDFYKRLGAEIKSDWRICRLEGDALRRAAGDVTP